MPAFRDLTGQVFNRLTVLEQAEKVGGRTAWRCLCLCGAHLVVAGHALVSGNTKSCGCLSRDATIKTWRKPMVGRTFGRLKVMAYVETKRKVAYWACQCICGKQTIANGGALRNGHIQSCGCLRNERVPRTHGRSRTPIYFIWKSMRQRCENPNNRAYRYYGMKGVTVCERWQDFALFFEDMGDPPEGLTIDRINPEGNYCPENCRWANWSVQNSNKRKRRKSQ